VLCLLVYSNIKKTETKIISKTYTGQELSQHSNEKIDDVNSIYEESKPINTEKEDPNAIVVSWEMPNDLDISKVKLESKSQGAGLGENEWNNIELEDGNEKDLQQSIRYSTIVMVNSIKSFQYRFVYDGSSGSSSRINPDTILVEVVNTKAGPSAKKRNSVLSIIDSSFSKTANAGSESPRIISREEWGCPGYKWPESKWNPEYTIPERVIVHHTADSYGGDSYAAMRAIWYYQTYRGTPDEPSDDWGDIGYNYVVDTQGNIFQGRESDSNIVNSAQGESVGAHALSFNRGTIGIALIGNYMDVNPPNQSLDSIARLSAYKLSLYGFNPADFGSFGPRLIGHRDVNQTACPGDRLHPRLPDLRSSASNYINSIYPLYGSEYSGYINSFKLYSDQTLTNELYQNNGVYYTRPNQTIYANAQITNIGKATWTKINTHMGTLKPTDRISQFADVSWLSNVRSSGFNEMSDVTNRSTATFSFAMKSPQLPGLYTESMGAVVDGVSWISGTEQSLSISVYNPVQEAITNSTITVNQSLSPGQNIMSNDSHTVLHFSFDGSLEVWQNYKKVWSSNTNGSGANRLLNQPDGNLVLYKNSSPIWSTATQGVGGNLIAQPDGNVVLYNNNIPVWNSATSTVNQEGIPNSVLISNDVIFPGQVLQSADGYYRLVAQNDGNLVLYTPTRNIWSSNTFMKKFNKLILQGDGNFVAYDGLWFPTWNSGTFSSGAKKLVLQDDGNVVLYNKNMQPVWSSGTHSLR